MPKLTSTLTSAIATGLTLDITSLKVDVQAATPPDFQWNKTVQRYQFASGASKGRFVNPEQVRNLTQKAIDQQKESAQNLVTRLINREIKVSEWERESAQLIKQASIWNYSLGIGGVGRLEAKDYGIIGNRLRAEYQYLRRFSQDILDGELSEAQIRARIELYFQKSRNLHERGRLEGHQDNGYLWERRIKPALESCSPCIRYKDMGWRPIGSLPNACEQCDCQSNCKCYKEFSDDETQPENNRLFVGYGWVERNTAH